VASNNLPEEWSGITLCVAFPREMLVQAVTSQYNWVLRISMHVWGAEFIRETPVENS
jgi:hypothetical protein